MHKNNFEAVILANGDFPTNINPLTILRSADYLVCCDLAGLTAIENGIKPDAIIGDGDSLPKEFKEKYASIFHAVSEQDDNDLTKATHYVKSLGKKRIAYIGATGKREDHTLANIALMVDYYRDLGLDPVMITDYGWFVVADGNRNFETFPRQQVSLFNISCTSLKSEGLKWNAYPFTKFWQGTLNEATSSTVTIKSNGIYIAYFTFEAKK